MGKSGEILSNFGNKRKRFFDIKDGEEVPVKFLHAEEIPNPYDKGKTTCIRYHLEFDGQKFLWDRISKSLAIQMADIPENTNIVIKRIGQKNETKYEIRLLGI